MIKKIPKSVFYGGGFGAALVAVALSSLGTQAVAAVSFLTQTDVGAGASLESRIYQQLSCADVPYDLTGIDVALSGSVQNVSLVVSKISGQGTWEKQKKLEVGRSKTTSFSSSQPTWVSFDFASPLSSRTLCKTPEDMIAFSIDTSTVPAPYPTVYGSDKATAYRSALYGCVLENGLPCLGNVRDVAFVLKTHPNHAPTISAIDPVTATEGVTFTFTLTGQDADGDTITWGSSNMPDGATLDTVSGVFTWTPGSDQVQDYKITFTATDDGGPVQESSSVVVFIHVQDVETPTENNRTLQETVEAYSFGTNIENSYLANLKNVDTFIERGQVDAATNQLEAFSHKIEQDLKQGVITEEQHGELLLQIQALAEKLGA